MSTIDSLELFIAPLFAIEELKHGHTCKVLLQIGVDTRDGYTDPAIRLPHGPAEAHRGEHDERQDGKREQRQFPVQFKHHHDNAEQGEEVLENGRDAGGKKVVENVNVSRDPCHQPAHRIAVKEAHLQALQVLEDLLSQVVHDFLADQLHRKRLPELQDERRQSRRQDEREGNLGDTDQRMGAQELREKMGKPLLAGRIEVAINFHLHEIGRNGLQNAVKERGDKRDRHNPPVRPQIVEQPPHQA